MGGDGRNVKSYGGLTSSGGQKDFREDILVYGGNRVVMDFSVRHPGDNRDMDHQRVHSVASGHHCSAHWLTEHL